MKLPLWRLLLGILVLAIMTGVLLSLTPVYYENYRLGQYVKQLARGPNATNSTEAALREQVLARARELDLPVQSGDIRITHADGKLQLQTRYAVEMNFPLYQVDLHFHADASGR